MTGSDKEFLKKLLITFRHEAEDHIQTLVSGFIELEKTPTPERQQEIVESIYREAHSLKGAARSVNIPEIDVICQAMENILAALKKKEIVPSPLLLDVLHQAIDTINTIMPAIDRSRTTSEKNRVSSTLKALAAISKKPDVIAQVMAGQPENTTGMNIQQSVVSTAYEFPKPQPEKSNSHLESDSGGQKKRELPNSEVLVSQKTQDNEAPVTAGVTKSAESVRISASRLEAILQETDDLLSNKLAATQLTRDIVKLNDDLSKWNSEWSRISLGLAGIMHQTSTEAVSKVPVNQEIELARDFLTWNHNFMSGLNEQVALLVRAATYYERSITGTTDNLIDKVRHATMFPFSSILEISPKIVRDISREQGKDADVTIRGDNIEIDRRILEELKDPLIHLLRNSVDHGIEKPEVRIAQGKPARGNISILISQQEGNKIEILIADDGRGIDTSKVLASAIKLGIVTPSAAEKLTEADMLLLVFQSGVTTSPLITSVSGRGLGMSIVQEKVEKVRGKIAVESTPGKGTKVKILLPVTLASFQGLSIRLGTQLFIIASNNVERVFRVKKSEIKTVENLPVVSIDGHLVSFCKLGDILGISSTGSSDSSIEYLQVVLLSSNVMRMAFAVDEILGENEIVVKKLGRQLAGIAQFSAVATLNSGAIALVLNVAELLKKSGTAAVSNVSAPEIVQTKNKSIMVVEDSITARALLKNILEMGGFSVKTAVDGAEAFALIKSGVFDLVVSDVDMPRMNGFELITKIRADKQLSELPVILVTAMESREHRERGVEVGANAYIVKSSFDQSNLIEIIKRLI